MEVSFILSTDEVFTLISLMDTQTEDGKKFVTEALAGGKINDLSGLVEKKLAVIKEDEIELVPVMKMIVDTIANADRAISHDNHWEICSEWVILRCERYPYKEEHWKISPVKGAVD